MTDQVKDIWKELRKPFDASTIGVIPKPYNKDSPKGQCTECGKYHALPATHLDYVGHAAVTDRLNTVVGPDGWNWEPMSVDENGLPRLDSKGNLWILLSIRNVVKLGYGDGSTSIKELIGDAIRNAAMRFGVALDLWSKEDLESTLADPGLKNERASTPEPQRPAVGSSRPEPTPMTRTQKAQIVALLRGQGVADDHMVSWVDTAFGVKLSELTIDDAPSLIEKIKQSKAGA